MAAEPTAEALGEICERFSHDKTQKKNLKRFGYLIGRWVYLMDALDDIEDDLKSGNYNPFVLSNPDIKDKSNISKIRENALLSLNLTLGEVARTYQKLEIKSFMPVLENIIYMGLPAMQEYIKIPKRSRKNDRSL